MDIEARLEGLERSNRRWRWCAAALGGVVALGGLAAMQPVQTRPLPNRLGIDRGTDAGFGVTFRGSPPDICQRQIAWLSLEDRTIDSRLAEVEQAVKDWERRIALLEKQAMPMGPVVDGQAKK